MRVLKASGESFDLEVTRDEMGAINNALNEVLHGIDVPEFQTRLGVAPEFAEDLLKQIHELLDDSRERA